VFLEGLKSAMLADFDPRAGDGARRPTAGIRAFAHVYAGWAYSHEFYRDELYRSLGYGSIAALLRGWEEEHLALDPRDLLAMLETWEHADISARDPFQGDFASALSAISADTILMPCSTDRYFPEVDAIYESAFIPRCEVRTLHSAFGHCALSPGRVPAALDFLDRTLTELLGR
jgi:homoserine O-acetyltransferase